MSDTSNTNTNEDLAFVRDNLEKLTDSFDRGDDLQAGMCTRYITERIISSYAFVYCPEEFHSSTFDKLNALGKGGFLSASTIDALHGLRKTGNKAAHPEKQGPPSHEEIGEQVLPVIRSVIDRWTDWLTEDHSRDTVRTDEPYHTDDKESSRDANNKITAWMSPGFRPAVEFSPDAEKVREIYASISGHHAFYGTFTDSVRSYKIGSFLQKASDGSVVACEHILFVDYFNETLSVKSRVYTDDGHFSESSVTSVYPSHEACTLEYCGGKCTPSIKVSHQYIRKMDSYALDSWLAAQEAKWPERVNRMRKERAEREQREAAEREKQEELRRQEEVADQVVQEKEAELIEKRKTTGAVLSVALCALCVYLGWRQTVLFFTETLSYDPGIYVVRRMVGLALLCFGAYMLRGFQIKPPFRFLLLLCHLYFVIPRLYQLVLFWQSRHTISRFVYLLICIFDIIVFFSFLPVYLPDRAAKQITGSEKKIP